MILNETTTADNEAIDIDRALDFLAQQIVLQVNAQRRRIFQNPKFTAAEVMAAFGNNAAKLVALYGQLADLLNAATPGAIDTALPFVLTPNADGTVTVSETPSSVPSGLPSSSSSSAAAEWSSGPDAVQTV